MKKSIYILFAGAFLITSCTHDPEPQHAAPEIDITNPSSGVVYHNGDTIIMQAVLSDEDELHEALIMVNDTADTFFLYQPYVHELDSFVVDTFWVVSGVSGTLPAFTTFHAENHHEKETTINLSILLQP
jgi:hypothetical protein